MPTLCIVLANSVCNTHRSGIDIVPSRQGRNLIVPCTAAFLRQRKGVAAGAATRTECHVNGHGTTTRRQTLLPAAIFLFYGFCHSASSGADLLFAAFCCIFAVQMKKRASVGPFFRVLKAVPLFGRLFFLSPKQENLSPKPCRTSGRPSNRTAKQAFSPLTPLNFPKRAFVKMSDCATGIIRLPAEKIRGDEEG